MGSQDQYGSNKCSLQIRAGHLPGARRGIQFPSGRLNASFRNKKKSEGTSRESCGATCAVVGPRRKGAGF